MVAIVRSRRDVMRSMSMAAGALVAVASAAAFVVEALEIAPPRQALAWLLVSANQQSLLAGLLGAALVCQQLTQARLQRLGLGLALAVTVVSALLALEQTLGVSFGFADLLFPAGLGALSGESFSRPSLPSSLELTMLGGALYFGKRYRGLPSSFLTLTALAYLFVTAIMVALRVQRLYGTGFMLPGGVILLTVLAIGILFSHPDRGLMKVISSETPVGVLLRRLIPTALLAPPVIGWLWAEATRLQIVQGAEGMFYATLAMTVVTLGIVAWNVYPLQRLERARNEAVSEQRRLFEEMALRTAELKKAEELNRLKDHFLSTISHEMKTPLSLIIGYGELLQEAYPQDPHVTGIKDGAQRLSRHIDAILDYSALISGTLPLYQTEVDLHELATHVLAQARDDFAHACIALEAEIAADLPLVEGDYRRLTQILLELLDNARKFTPPGGRVGLRIAPEGAMVRLAVWNTGDGIPPQDCERIWEAFHQLATRDAQRKGGLGLGLTIVKMLVELHGGTVSMTTDAEAQTTFSILLPALSEPDEASAPRTKGSGG